MMAVARANAANGNPWDPGVVIVTYLFVRLFGFVLGAPRRILAGTARRIGSTRGITSDR
jgi:hypothetical protein